MERKNELRKNNKGFSLVELIVVIAIMAVLVAVIAPQLIKYVDKGRESSDTQTISDVATALQTYYTDNEIPSGGVSVTITTDGVGDSPDAAITDAGLNDVKLSSGNWGDSGVIVTLGENGQISYGGAHGDYYNADGTAYKEK